MKKYYLVLAIVAVVYTLMSAWTPMQLDDYLFMDVYHCHSGDSSEFSWEAMKGYVDEIRTNDNSRIANISAPLFLMFEPFRTVYPYLTGVLCALIVWLICRLSSRGGRASVAKCVLVWTLFIVFLPWRNNIFVTDYALNYIYSSAITMGTIALMLRFEHRGWHAASVIGVTVLAAIAGGWHEGFAFPAVGALIVYGWIERRRVSWQWWAVTAVYTISAFVFALSPGLLSRAHSQVGGYNFVGYFKMFVDLALVYVLIGVMAVLLIYTKGKRYVLTIYKESSAMIIFSVAMVLSAVLSMSFHASARTAFFPELCAIVCAMILSDDVWSRISKKYIHISTVLLLVLCLAQSTAALVWQHKLYDEDRYMIEHLTASEQGCIFYDYTQPEDVPVYTLYFPARTAWVGDFHYYCLKQYLRRDIVCVAPVVLSDTTLTDEPIGEAYRRGGALWLRNDPDIDAGSNITLNVRMQGDDTWRELPVFSNKYIGADGDTLIYIKVFNTDPAAIAEVKTIR